jgi:hypothetical protein
VHGDARQLEDETSQHGKGFGSDADQRETGSLTFLGHKFSLSQSSESFLVIKIMYSLSK